MINLQAVHFNSRVVNNYGSEKFIVTHSGGIVEHWSANNRKHLDRLLRIQLNMGYILSIDKVDSANQLFLEFPSPFIP